MAVPSVLSEGGLWLAFGVLAGLAYLPAADHAGAVTILRFAAQGMLIMALLFASERLLRTSPLANRLQHLPFMAAWAVRSLLSTTVIALALGLGDWLLAGSTNGLLNGPPPVRDLVYAVSAAATFQIALLVRAAIGGRVLLNALFGRYRRPLDERRIFLVLDLAGSTGLAERLGGLETHRLLSCFFADVAKVTGRFGGETHAYIGDQAIVTWPMTGNAVIDARPVACGAALLEMMAERQAHYQARFGLVPQFRVTLHGGAVVAGECGSDRRQIVYYGDAIVTAVRLQDVGKASGHPILISSDLLDRIVLPAGCSTLDLGLHDLRGRLAPLRVAALGAASARSGTLAPHGRT